MDATTDGGEHSSEPLAPVPPSVSKKTLATWKKQLKNLKTKDAGKKTDGLRYCAQDEQFVREQSEVLPVLMDLLSRVKMPDVITETLRTFKTLFTENEAAIVRSINVDTPVASATEPASLVVELHPQQNRQFVVDASSIFAASAWKAGAPFVNLFGANISPEIKIQAIEVFSMLLDHCTQLAVSGVETESLLEFQTTGSPATALLACLAVDHTPLQLAALECMCLLFEHPPHAEFLAAFHTSDGLTTIQQFVSHPERRFHAAVLKIVESFSQHEIGRGYLRASGMVDSIRALLVATLATTTATIAAANATPTAPITLTLDESTRMHENVAIAVRCCARMLFAREILSPSTRSPFDGEYASVPIVVETLISILQRDISTCVLPPPSLAVPTGNNAAAQAAAAQAAATAATLAALFPFSSAKCVGIISGLGRMVEASDRVQHHAKRSGLLPILVQAFRVPGDNALHQSADKLLHLCARVSATPSNSATLLLDPSVAIDAPVDPQLFSIVHVSSVSADDAGEISTVDQPPLLSIDTVIPILESASIASGIEDATKPAHSVVFRLVRWLAVAVDSPANAQALGESAMSALTKLFLETDKTETILCGFLVKCIQAIAIQNPDACELCGSETRNPVSAIAAFMLTAYPSVDPPATHRTASVAFEMETLGTQETTSEMNRVETTAKAEAASEYKLEWVNELDESETEIFAPRSLTEYCHTFDPFFFAAKTLEVLVTAHARARAAIASDGVSSIDFADLLTQRVDAGSKTLPATTKKKTTGDLAVKPSSNGEAVVLCVLEKVAEIFRLLGTFSSKNGDVAVSLLTTIRALVQLPGGVRAVLSLAKTAIETMAVESRDTTEGDEASSTVVVSQPATILTWPWTREQACGTEHSWLLAPILSVFETSVTCFFQLEAAVAVLAAIVEDAPDPGISPPPPTSGVISSVEIPITDTDKFINAALTHGVLVYLLAILDGERVPRCPTDGDQRQQFIQSTVALALRLLERGAIKQSEAVAKRQELLDLHDQLTAAAEAALAAGGKATKLDIGPTIDVASLQIQKLEFQTTWARELLDAAFDLPRFDYRRVPALLLAIEIGQDEIALALLAAGVNPDATTSLDSTTPLMLALLTKNKPLVFALLEAGASVDAITQDGMDISVWTCTLATPIRDDLVPLLSRVHRAKVAPTFVVPLDTFIELDSEQGTPDMALFETLLNRGLDVNVSNAEGDFVLHAVLSQCVVRKRIRGLDVCFRYRSASSFMEPAVLLKLVANLVEHHRADLDACNRLGQTPLHVALLHGHTDAILYLLKNGANPNVRDVFGLLPIHYACLGFVETTPQAIQVVEALLATAPKHELVQGVHTDRRKYKTPHEKQAVEVEALLHRGFADVSAPPALVRTLATVDHVLNSASESPDGFLPWHLACGACSHLNASRLCLSDEMNARLSTNGAIRAAILDLLLQNDGLSLATRTTRQLTGLHLAVKTDVDGSNTPVIDVLFASACLPAILNAVHEPTAIDTMLPIEEGALVELSTEKLLYVPHAHVSARSSHQKYHVILPDGTHLEDLDRHQLKPSIPTTGASRYTLRLESAFSALHYALKVSDDLARRLLALPGVALQPEGSDLPLLALACAARRSPDIVARLVNPQANMRVYLPLHDSTSHEQTQTSDSGGRGRSSGSRAAASRKQAAALHFAVLYEDVGLVRALVTRKDHTNVNVRRSGDGFAPLHLACGMGDMPIVQLLLSAGANLIQMSTVSSSSSGVTPLHLLIKNDGMENEKLKELVDKGFLQPEMLLEGLGAPAVFTADTLTGGGGDFDEDEMEISCVLLDEEEHNLSLFNHVQQLRETKRSATGYAMRLQSELSKSDNVLSLFFQVIGGNSTGASSLSHVTEEDADASDTPRGGFVELPDHEASVLDAQLQFAQLKHWHECYAHKTVRSQWTADATLSIDKTRRRSSFDRRSTRELLALSDEATATTESQQ